VSWYNEKEHGEYKAYLEWCYGIEMQPVEDCPHYYEPKGTESD